MVSVSFFFTYLIVFAAGMFVVEPLAIITAIVYTIRANREGRWSWTLTFCWVALILHSAAIAFAFYVSAAGPRGIWNREKAGLATEAPNPLHLLNEALSVLVCMI